MEVDGNVHPLLGKEKRRGFLQKVFQDMMW